MLPAFLLCSHLAGTVLECPLPERPPGRQQPISGSRGGGSSISRQEALLSPSSSSSPSICSTHSLHFSGLPNINHPKIPPGSSSASTAFGVSYHSCSVRLRFVNIVSFHFIISRICSVWLLRPKKATFCLSINFFFFYGSYLSAKIFLLVFCSLCRF